MNEHGKYERRERKRERKEGKRERERKKRKKEAGVVLEIEQRSID